MNSAAALLLRAAASGLPVVIVARRLIRRRPEDGRPFFRDEVYRALAELVAGGQADLQRDGHLWHLEPGRPARPCCRARERRLKALVLAILETEAACARPVGPGRWVAIPALAGWLEAGGAVCDADEAFAVLQRLQALGLVELDLWRTGWAARGRRRYRTGDAACTARRRAA